MNKGTTPFTSPQSPLGSPRHTSAFARVLQIVVLVVLGSVLLFVVGVFALFSWSAHQRNNETAKQTENAKEAVTRAYAQNKAAADTEFEQRLEVLEQAGLIDHPIASSKINLCGIQQHVGGWVTTSWSQECHIQYVEGFTTNLDKETLKQKLLALPSARTLLGKENAYSDCNLIGDGLATDVIFRLSGTPSGDSNCTVPSQKFGASGTELDGVVSKEYKSFDPSKIDSNQSQIWLSYRRNYYTEDLGCGGVGYPCENPRPKAVLGE